MSEGQSLQRIPGHVKEKEKCDWLGAVEFYEKAAVCVVGQKDLLEASKIGKTSGCCFYRAAFQAETQEEFGKRMQLSTQANKNAAEQFEKVHKQTRANYWIAPNYMEKKRLLDSFIEL